MCNTNKAFYIFYRFFFFFFFFEVTIFYKIFPKMSENLSAKYCQDNKERLQRKPREKY